MVGALVTRLVDGINKDIRDTVDGAIMAADLFLLPFPSFMGWGTLIRTTVPRTTY